MNQMETRQICPNCGSTSSVYDFQFDFWTCNDCLTPWSDGKNDPDFEDCNDPDALEAIAERNIELINQWQPKQ